MRPKRVLQGKQNGRRRGLAFKYWKKTPDKRRIKCGQGVFSISLFNIHCFTALLSPIPGHWEIKTWASSIYVKPLTNALLSAIMSRDVITGTKFTYLCRFEMWICRWVFEVFVTVKQYWRSQKTWFSNDSSLSGMFAQNATYITCITYDGIIISGTLTLLLRFSCFGIVKFAKYRLSEYLLIYI